MQGDIGVWSEQAQRMKSVELATVDCPTKAAISHNYDRGDAQRRVRSWLDAAM
jgi:hypothetical protein